VAAAFLLGAVASAPAAAPLAAQGAPPAAGTPGAAASTTPGAAAVPALRFEKYTLPNGLEVILHEDHSVPLVAVNTYYKVGSGDEQRGRTGFAHLFEHVMFMGSQNVPVGAFDQWLEAAGANNNGSTSTGPHQLLRVDAVERAAAGALARRRPHGLPAADDGPAEARPAARRGEERAPRARRQRALRPRLRDGARRPLPGRAPVLVVHHRARWPT
jgi:hypothetical protein